MSMLSIVGAWIGTPNPARASVPANFLSRAFELNNPALYTRDVLQPGTAAEEIIGQTLKALRIGLDARRGEATNGKTLFSRVYATPERKFLVNGQGGVALFTQLARPEAPEKMAYCLVLAQASRAADHLLEAHEYEPVFCLTGHHAYAEDGGFEMVVDTLHQQRQSIKPTITDTKLALAYADICFAQLLSGAAMQPKAAAKIVDALSLSKLDATFFAMKGRAASSAADHPRVIPPAATSYGIK